MNNDHSEHDQRVSEVYRELANEKTPTQLDAAVLRAAGAGASRSRLGLSGWMRPAAWAATVGLSLAIVLEVTRVPDDGVPDVPAASSVEEAFKPRDNDMLDYAEDLANSRNGPDQGTDLNEALASPAQSDSEVAPDTLAIVVDTAPAPGSSSPPERKREAAKVEEAEARTEADAAAAAVTSGLLMRSAQVDRQDSQFCNDDVREDAATWYRCVEQLRNAGQEAHAANELSDLSKAFPDFSPAETDIGR